MRRWRHWRWRSRRKRSSNVWAATLEEIRRVNRLPLLQQPPPTPNTALHASRVMHTYLNNLLCTAAPCDGEMQDAIEHAIATGEFNPTGVLLTDNETIGRDGAAWLTSWRAQLEREAQAHAHAVDFMLAALERPAA